MIIGKEEKARLWEKYEGKCAICCKTVNPFNEVIFHAYNGRHIEMYCPKCEVIISSRMNAEKELVCKETATSIDKEAV
jgi:hypothetical protein